LAKGDFRIAQRGENDQTKTEQNRGNGSYLSSIHWSLVSLNLFDQDISGRFFDDFGNIF
jgi:hypothetical protein